MRLDLLCIQVGNLSPIFAAAYPSCWKTHKTCTKQLLGSLTYTQVAGIIVGMLTIGEWPFPVAGLILHRKYHSCKWFFVMHVCDRPQDGFSDKSHVA